MRPETARRYAYLALPFLVSCARQRQTIYYGQLGSEIGLNAQGIGPVLNYIRDDVCIQHGLPHLSIIVVRDDKTQRPPDEVIEESGIRPGETHQAAFKRLRDEVFAHDSWDDLLSDLGLELHE
jgi:hypothetical protein